MFDILLTRELFYIERECQMRFIDLKWWVVLDPRYPAKAGFEDDKRRSSSREDDKEGVTLVRG